MIIQVPKMSEDSDNSSTTSSDCSSSSGECEICKEHFSKTQEQLDEEDRIWTAKHNEEQRTRRDIITEENKDVIEQTPDVINKTIENWGTGLRLVREEFHNFALYQKAVKHHYDAIAYVKRNLLTRKQFYALCRESLKKNGYNIKNIPKDVITHELFELALQSAIWIIKGAKNKFKTYKNCLYAVSGNGEILEHIPKEHITEEMVRAAVKNRNKSLKYIPKHMITQEICKKAVKSNGENIQFVPEEFMSSELCLIAVQSDEYPGTGTAGVNISFIPTRYYTKELILKAVEHTSYYYSYIPKEFITKDIEDAALEIEPRIINYVEQTPERCLKVLKANPYIILHSIKRESITKEVAELVLTFPRKILKRFTDNFMEYVKSKLQD
jgi:hypothetical protein